MIKWYFTGQDIFFISTEESLDRDILKSAHRLGLEPTHKIIKLNDNRTNAESGPTDSTPSNGNSDPQVFTALQVDPTQTETPNDETTGLRGVSDVLDELRSPLSSVGNPSANGTSSLPIGSVSGKRSRKGI